MLKVKVLVQELRKHGKELLYLMNNSDKVDQFAYRELFNKANSDIKFKVESINLNHLKLNKKELEQLHQLIKNNISETIDLIQRNKSPYNLGRFDETNKYINHQITNIGSILFSFNQLLIDLVFSYCLNNKKSYYLKEDNSVILHNWNILKTETYMTLDHNVIFLNNLIDEFDTKFSKLISNITPESISKNIEKLRKNSKYFHVGKYFELELSVIEDEVKALKKEVQASILKQKNTISKNNNIIMEVNILLEKRHKLTLSYNGLYDPEITIYAVKSLGLNKNEENQLLCDITSLVNKLGYLKEENRETLRENIYAAELIKEIECKNNIGARKELFIKRVFEMSYFDSTNHKELTDINFINQYNDVISVIKKKVKLKKLLRGMEFLFNFYGVQGNDNKLENLLNFLYKNNVIPEFLVKEISLYEILFRHQYAHGWHKFFNILLENSYKFSFNPEFPVESMIMDNSDESKDFSSILRRDFKRQSLTEFEKAFYSFQWGIENNIGQSESSIFSGEKIIKHNELLVKFQMKQTPSYIKKIKDFQDNNKIFVFDNQKIDNEIKYREEHSINNFYYMSMNGLIYLIYTFMSFYIKGKQQTKEETI